MFGTEVVGILLLLWSLVCLGTWPALLRLGCGEWSSQPRAVSLVYLDYALTYVGVSTVPLLSALCLSPRMVDDPDEPSLFTATLVAAATLGGTLLALGNLSYQWATAVGNQPVTTVLCVQGSLTVVLGAGVNYGLEPEMTTRPEYLAAGVVVFLLAIALATRAQVLQQKQKERLEQAYYHWTPDGEFTSSSSSASVDTITENKKEGNHSWLGTGIALLGGLAYGFFSPAFNVAVNDPFDWSERPKDSYYYNEHRTKRDPGLLVFYANLWFSLAFGVISVVGNLALLRLQMPEENLYHIVWKYLTQTSWVDRRVAFLAGIVCAAGNVLQFQGAQHVGYATADLVQAYPLVSTVWDILLFGEFASVRWCHSWLSFLLFGMYLSYVGGIVLLALSCFD